jgi:hypothetical protein
MVENYDVLSSLAYTCDGVLTLGEWVRSFGRVEEAAWFARDDPGPFALMCAAFPIKLALAAIKGRFSNLRPR